MKILAFEFSSARRSVAVVADGAVQAEAWTQGDAGPGAVALIDQALADAGWERESIDRLAVGLGPGSYTGIRMALALGIGWSVGRTVPVVGVGSFEVMAAQLASNGFLGRAHLVVDAQQAEYALAEYEINQSDWHSVDPIRLVGRAILETSIRQGRPTYGPGLTLLALPAADLYPTAGMLGRLAESSLGLPNMGPLEPIYVRPAQFKKAAPSKPDRG